MWRFVLLFTATMEDDVKSGDLRVRLTSRLYGALNLYWCCLFGHRAGVHTNMTDAMVIAARKSGSEEKGYVVQVSGYTYHVLITR